MPFKEGSKMSNRREFVTLARNEGANIRELCRRFGIYTASRMLRHSRISVTEQHYVDPKERVTVGLGRLLPTRPTNIVSINAGNNKLIHRKAIQ